MASAGRDVANMVYQAYRDPSVSERDHENYQRFRDRLTRCTAFGQTAQVFAASDQPTAQHGLFGTAAALQVLSNSEWAVAVKEGKPLAGAEPWQRRYLQTLNFLDLVLTRGERPGSEAAGGGDDLWTQQKAMTIRICQVFRALCSAAPLLPHITPIPDEAQLVGEMTPLAEFAAHHARTLLGLLQACVATPEEVGGPGHNMPGERTWRYTVGGTVGPKRSDEWVFMWAQILVVVARARAAALITEEDVVSLCRTNDIGLFRREMSSPPPDLDRRIWLFGLWALSHFDISTRGGPLGILSESDMDFPHSLEQEHCKQLRKCVGEARAMLMMREATLSDSWTPYSLKQEGDKWRDDFMVVPTVPLLLALTARYYPHHLSERHTLELIRDSTDSDRQRDIGRAKPYQNGNRDGVVNLAYWQEAYSELSASDAALGADAKSRVAATLYGSWKGYGRLAAVLGIVVLTVASYVGWVREPSSVILGLVFGLGAAYIAAIASPPVVAFLWGDRFT